MKSIILIFALTLTLLGQNECEDNVNKTMGSAKAIYVLNEAGEFKDQYRLIPIYEEMHINAIKFCKDEIETIGLLNTIHSNLIIKGYLNAHPL